MTRRISGIFLCVVFVCFGIINSRGWWWVFIEENRSVIEISGFGNIWASVAGVLMFGTLLCFLFVSSMKWIDKNAHIIAIITAFVLSPIIAGGISYTLKNKSSGFVECSELSRSSRFYSSKTYAITAQECLRLSER